MAKVTWASKSLEKQVWEKARAGTTAPRPKTIHGGKKKGKVLASEKKI